MPKTHPQTVLPIVDTQSTEGQRQHFSSGVALRAIAEFECLGSECEDTCCSGWNIPLSQDDIVRLRRAANADIGTRRIFKEVVGTEAKGPVRGTSGQLQMGSSGFCSFLDDKKLCTVQTACGPEAIPTVCGLYPRRLSAVGSRLEVTPLLSCPEAARNLLLRPEGADLVEVDPLNYPRVVANHIVSQHPNDPFEQHMDEVRGVMLELLLQDDIPFDIRFLFTATLSDGLHTFFGRGNTNFDEAMLAATIAEFTDSKKLAEIWESFDRTTQEYTLGASVAYQAIAPRAKGSRKLTELFAGAMSTYGPESGLEAAFTQRAETFDTLLGARWDSHFTRLSINSWLQSYLDSDTLLEHCRGLAIRLQAIRFLVLGDPKLEEARHRVEVESGPQAQLQDAFDEAFVRVLYRFSRATEHDPNFWASVTSALDGNGFTTFAHVARLIPRRMAS